MKKYSLAIVALAFLSLAPSVFAAAGSNSMTCANDNDCTTNYPLYPYCNLSTYNCHATPQWQTDNGACTFGGSGAAGLCRPTCAPTETGGVAPDRACASRYDGSNNKYCCVPPATTTHTTTDTSGTTHTTTDTSGTTHTTADTTTNPTYLINPLSGGGDLQSFLQNILGFIIKIGSIILILMLVFVGYKFVAAQGEPSKLEEARRMLLWTVVGGLVLLGAQAIASGILATVNAIAGGH